MTITAAADGSALSNPGPMGWAWYIDDGCWSAGGAPHGTNNQGELTAVLELLRATAGTTEPLLIECDSRYVIDSITKWMPGWKKRGWRKADGGPVLNRELMESLDEAMRSRNVRFEWVKGHAGHPRNEAADARANAAATAYRDGAEPARGPGYTGAAAKGEASGVSATAPAVAGSPSATSPSATSPSATSPAASASAAAALIEPPAPPAALWDEDLFAEPAPVRVTLELSPTEFARLKARAAASGTTPEQALRALI